MRGQDPLAPAIAGELFQVSEKPSIEDRRIAAVVVVAGDRNPVIAMRADQPGQACCRQVRLVRHTNQDRGHRRRQRGDAARDRPGDSRGSRRILNQLHVQSFERPAQSRIGRDDNEDWLQPRLQKSLGGAAHQGDAVKWLEQFLTSEAAGLASGEEDACDQPAVAAALSCSSTQLPNRCVSRWATSCMIPLRPNCATTPLT